MWPIPEKQTASQRYPQMDLTEETNSKVPKRLRALLEQQDGAAKLVRRLPRSISPREAATSADLQRRWELCGLYYLNRGRFHEAIAVFHGLYDHLLAYQDENRKQTHKGMPLLWLSHCHGRLGHPVTEKRFLTLTACEDAIRGRGTVNLPETGVYFRLVWSFGLTHEQVTTYAKACWELYKSNRRQGRFPEWILQELSPEWSTDTPTPPEMTIYESNQRYIAWLISLLGGGDGKALERLAHYLLSSIPGCRAHMRWPSHSTDYDVIGVFEGPIQDFRWDTGRHFVCECKDWRKPADFTTFAKFCRVLDSTKCRFGILFSKKGLSGERRTEDARREQLKVFQDRGVVVIVVDESDLKRLAKGENFITMMRSKYEEVRLDLKLKIDAPSIVKK